MICQIDRYVEEWLINHGLNYKGPEIEFQLKKMPEQIGLFENTNL